MARAIDSQPLPFDRDPLRNILGGIPKQPPVDFAALQQAGITWFNTMFGDLIDTSAWDDAKAKWTQIINQIGALFTLVQSPVSAAQWAVWWSNTLTVLGIDAPTAATVANWLSGNYDAAKAAKKAWDDFLASWDVGTPADVAAATALNIARTKRKAQNDAIIADWLHQKYPLGSITDTATTLIGGKRTWWGAVNDNLLLVAQIFGLAQETPDPTADVGTAAQAAQATANTGVTNAGLAQTAAGTAQTTANTATTKSNQNAAWAARKSQNDKILGDWLHTTYPLGSLSDTASTLVGGKRTYWGAWNDNLLIISEQLGISTPTDPLVDIGTQTQANTAAANTAAANAALASAANQDLTNKIISSQTGVEPTTGTSADAYDALTNIPASNIQGQTGATVTYGTTGAPLTNNGAYSDTLVTNYQFTPLSTDTQIDVIVAFMGASGSTRTISCQTGSTVHTQVIRQAATSFSGNTNEIAVFRVPVTPTASPPQRTFTISVSSTNGYSYVSIAAISYAGVKTNYSTSWTGSLTAGNNTVSMQRITDGSKRLFLVATTGSSGTPTITAGSGASQKVNFGNAGATPKLFIQDQGGFAGTNTASCTIALPSGTIGQFAAVLVEISN